MRTLMLALLALVTVLPSVGCVGARGACGACQHCDHGGGCVRNGLISRHFCGGTGLAFGGGLVGNGGYTDRHVTPTQEGMGAPSTAQVAYPYYTTRGPRDFLMNNPPTIGY